MIVEAKHTLNNLLSELDMNNQNIKRVLFIGNTCYINYGYDEINKEKEK